MPSGTDQQAASMPLGWAARCRHRLPEWLAQLPLLAAGALFALPYLNPRHHDPLPAFYAEWMAAALLLICATLLLGRSAWRRPLVPAAATLPAGLAAIALAQQALGRASQNEAQLLFLLYLLGCALAMIAGQALRQRWGFEPLMRTLASWLLAGALASALIAVIALHAPQLLPGLVEQDQAAPVARGNLMQRNHLANYLWGGIMAALFLHVHGKLASRWLVAALAPLLLVLALTGSKSAFLYLAGSAALAGLWYWRSPSPQARRLLIIALLLVPAFFAAQEIGAALGQNGRFPTTASLLADQISAVAAAPHQSADGFSVRWFLFKMGLAIWLDAPLLGHGAGSFAWQSFVRAVDFPAGFQGHAEHAHNIVAQVAVEFGLAGLGLLALAAVLWGRRVASEKWSAAHLWLLSLLMVQAVHSLLEYPLWYAYFLLPAALLAGAVDPRAALLRPSLSLRGAALVLLLLGATVLNTLRADYLRLERVVYPGLDRSRAFAKPQGFNEINPILLKILKESLLAPYIRLMYAANLAPSRELLADKLLVSELAMRFAPVKQVVFKHALLLALAGRHEEAQLQLKRAMRGYPAEIPKFVAEITALQQKNAAEGGAALYFDALLRAAEAASKP